jgi:maltooligosyltrehalose trehalohydrolase
MGIRAGVARLGAIPAGDDRAEFCVWAPNARTIAVRLASGAAHPLDPREDGVFEGVVEAAAGEDYRFVLDGDRALPDPCSRCQPEGVLGPSRLLDTAFEIAPGPELPLDELVLYELHVGTFSEAGTFDGVVPHLPRLRELGVTALELMPVATFPGERGWVYDGVYVYAPHRAYGGPEELARLVDGAHREGLAVFLDVVYNHVGPGSEALAAFGPYFTERHEAPWARRSTTRSAGCASGRSRTRSSGCATTGSTGCGSTRSSRSSTTRARSTSCASCASGCRRRS